MVQVLLEFIGDTNVDAALDVVLFLRDVIESYPQLRNDLLTRLLAILPTVKAGKVWICIYMCVCCLLVRLLRS